MRLGGGQEVAKPTWPAQRGEVVPPRRMIECQLHEPGEGDAATGGVDFGADDRDQIRIATVGNLTVIGIESAGWRGTSHDGDCRGKEDGEQELRMPPV